MALFFRDLSSYNWLDEFFANCWECHIELSADVETVAASTKIWQSYQQPLHLFHQDMGRMEIISSDAVTSGLVIAEK